MAVGFFYRWEDHNHGLEHKCGTCGTVLSSPRAKTTCFGIHEEVCPAYHKTLHFVGMSHQCVACSNTVKAHNKRHIEIAEIIRAIHRLEGNSNAESPLRHNKRKAKKRDDAKPDPSDDVSVHDQEQEVEWDSTSSTLYNDDVDSKERKQAWSGIMESADARRAAKAERKAAKNQVLFEVITQEDLTQVEKALHPESDQQASAASKGQGLADNQTIDENIAFNASTFRWSGLRQGVHAKRLAKNNGGKPKANTPQQDNEIISPIFASLGITTNLSKASKERKSLNTKLRAAILGDLAAFKNDQVETMQRMAGYWRYANRRTYNEMIRNNEIWDWATGERLPEIREEVELDAIEEEDENAEAATLIGETEGRIPEDWDDADFELPIGQITLSLTSNTLTKQSDADRDTKLDKGLESTPDCITNTTSKPSLDPGRFINQTVGSNALPPSPPISNTKDEKAFQGVKDTRVFAKTFSPAVIHAPQPIRIPSAPAIQSRDAPDPLNRFGALDNETPAPCEEVRKPDPPLVIKIPAKPIIKTLAIHDEEDNWQTQHRYKGKKGAKGGPAMALREQAAVNVHARKFGEGKSFAAAVKKGL